MLKWKRVKEGGLTKEGNFKMAKMGIEVRGRDGNSKGGGK